MCLKDIQAEDWTFGKQSCDLDMNAFWPLVHLVFLFSAGLPDGFNDVRGGPLWGERAPHLQRKHTGHKGHRRIPETGGTEVPAGRPW